MKICRVCRTRFEPSRPFQIVCSILCSRAWAQSEESRKLVKQAKQREKREFRYETESRRSLLKKAQEAFNGWVRERDKRLPCISCGAYPEPKPGGTMDCGHYRSTGAMAALRFHEDNAAGQCVRCNRDLSGNSVAYRKGLLERIGAERVAWIEGHHEPRKWTREELREIQSRYLAATRKLKQQEGA